MLPVVPAVRGIPGELPDERERLKVRRRRVEARRIETRNLFLP